MGLHHLFTESITLKVVGARKALVHVALAIQLFVELIANCRPYSRVICLGSPYCA